MTQDNLKKNQKSKFSYPHSRGCYSQSTQSSSLFFCVLLAEKLQYPASVRVLFKIIITLHLGEVVFSNVLAEIEGGKRVKHYVEVVGCFNQLVAPGAGCSIKLT